MNVAATFLSVLAGLFVGVWLSGGGTPIPGVPLPLLALVALILAMAGTPRGAETDGRAQAAESFRSWLDAWRRARMAQDRERAETEEELAAASRLLVLTAKDRVLKALQSAGDREFSPEAVAQLILEMRRSLGLPSLTIRSADIARLIAEPVVDPVAQKGQRAESTVGADSALFLS